MAPTGTEAAIMEVHRRAWIVVAAAAVLAAAAAVRFSWANILSDLIKHGIYCHS